MKEKVAEEAEEKENGDRPGKKQSYYSIYEPRHRV